MCHPLRLTVACEGHARLHQDSRAKNRESLAKASRVRKKQSVKFDDPKRTNRHTHGAVAAGTEEEEDGHWGLISVDETIKETHF